MEKQYLIKHALLPISAQIELMEAASTEPEEPRGKSIARKKAVDNAVKSVKKRYPSYFRKEI